MGRPRTPTHVLELRGAFKNHPARGKARENEPKPSTKVGPPPDDYDEIEARTWNEMAEHGFWLTGPDKFMLAIAVRLLASHRQGLIDRKEVSILINVLSKLGFGPSERSKLSVPEPKEEATSFASFV